MPRTEDPTGTGTLKTCPGCKIALPLYAFRADASRPDGRYPRCKMCCGSNLIQVIYRRPCAHCRTYFRPRHNKGVYVSHCSRRCHAAASRGPNHASWKGSEIKYSAAHMRVRQARGEPAQCAHCNTTAGGMHWALDHDRCTEPLLAPEGPYSPDPNHYIPLCVPCHKVMDLGRG
jgi:hypothetical protein